MPRNSRKSLRAANGLGSVKPYTKSSGGREKTYYRARLTMGIDPKTGKQIQREKVFLSQAEAVETLNKWKSELSKGELVVPRKIKVSEYLSEWSNKYLYSVEASTKLEYTLKINRYIIPAIGSVNLQKLTTAMIQNMYEQLMFPVGEAKPLSAKTIKDINGVLHKALEQAVALGYISKNPSDACSLPKVKTAEIIPFDHVQLGSFIEACKGSSFENLFYIAVMTGLREGEILALTWDCVDLDKHILHICKQVKIPREKGAQRYLGLPKHNKIRDVPFPEEADCFFTAQKAIQEKMKQDASNLWNENNLVFSNAVGDFLSRQTVYCNFKKIVKSIGLPDKRFHDLRHTYAVMLLESGENYKVLQENMGHVDAGFTLRRYGHVTERMRSKSASHLSNYLKENRFFDN